MTDSGAPWHETERGVSPERRWSFTADAPLAAMCMGRECGELFVADKSGGLYLIDRRGQVVSLTRGFQQLHGIAWSDTGSGGVAAANARNLCLLDRSLKVAWSVELGDDILGVAIDPFGDYVAAALANGNNVVFDRNKTRLCRFDTVRPLSYIRFVPSAAIIVGVAEYGLICCHELGGARLWDEKTWNNVGDVSVSGFPKVIHIAAYNHGVQTFAVGDGSTRGSFQVEGTPNRVSCSYSRRRLAVATLERHLYWLDDEGEILWAAHTHEDVAALQCDPLGSGFACGFASGRIAWLEWGLPDGEATPRSPHSTGA